MQEGKAGMKPDWGQLGGLGVEKELSVVAIQQAQAANQGAR